MKCNYQPFFALLRLAMTGEQFDSVPTAEEWSEFFKIAGQQSVMGVCYTAFPRLSDKQLPPMELMVQWMAEAETIRGLNELQNKEAARLTQLFSEQGRKTAILKGQANARLYRDKLSRQVGDIDIWVEGGRDSVVALLKEMGLVEELGKVLVEHKSIVTYHHVHLLPTKDHITVEVHFRPSSGNFNPLTNRRLQHWLEQEILSVSKVEEEFFVPSVRFALVMQLAHIQSHFLLEGLGMRHLCDYFCLLKNATEEDRRVVASVMKAFGLRHTAEALMWVLGEVLHLEEEKMYCKKDAYRGEWMLREMMEGGNFGHSAKRHKTDSDIVFSFRKHKRYFQLAPFAPCEMLFLLLDYWRNLLARLPERIRYRKLSLR